MRRWRRWFPSRERTSIFCKHSNLTHRRSNKRDGHQIGSPSLFAIVYLLNLHQLIFTAAHTQLFSMGKTSHPVDVGVHAVEVIVIFVIAASFSL